jgi:hypothetical protein
MTRARLPSRAGATWVNEYPGLLDEGVVGNPNEMDERERDRRAWEIVSASTWPQCTLLSTVVRYARWLPMLC